MPTVEGIKADTLKLAAKERSQLARWLLELNEQRWDAQKISKDAAAGKLDFLAKEAIENHKAGNTHAI